MSHLVDIGGRRLEVICSGARPPTVVFESGAGRGAADWDPVRSLIDPGVRAFAYSRAGQGRSDPPAPENIIFDDGEIQVASAESRTDDLERLLAVTGPEPPYVLVGHSLGGIYIRLLAERHPDTVAGLVFVDSSHPDQASRIREAFINSGVSTEAREQYFAAGPSPNAPVIEAGAHTGPFGHIPVAVLSQDPARPVDDDDTTPPQIRPVHNRVWAELQAELTELSACSSQTVVTGAGHMLHQDAPGAVAQAIMDMVDRADS